MSPTTGPSSLPIPAGTFKGFSPPWSGKVKAPVGGMRDRWGIEERPVAHERDHRRVDPRPGGGLSWVCSMTTRPGGDPRRMETTD